MVVRLTSRRSRTDIVAGLVAIGLAVSPTAACTSAPSSKAPPPPAGATPASPQPLPSDETAVRLQVERTGGLAGQTHTLNIDTAGRWTYSAGREKQKGKLNEPQARQIWRLANNPKLAAEIKRKGSPPACADGFRYTIVIGEDRRVRAVDCGELPRTLQALIDMLVAATPL